MVRTRKAECAGDLQDALRGIPQGTPLRIVTPDGREQSVSIGYGTDPDNHSRRIVLLDLIREGSP